MKITFFFFENQLIIYIYTYRLNICRNIVTFAQNHHNFDDELIRFFRRLHKPNTQPINEPNSQTSTATNMFQRDRVFGLLLSRRIEFGAHTSRRRRFVECRRQRTRLRLRCLGSCAGVFQRFFHRNVVGCFQCCVSSFLSSVLH